MSARAWWRYLLPAEVRQLAREEFRSLLKVVVILLPTYGVEWLFRWKWRESQLYYLLVWLDDWLAFAMLAWILFLKCVRFFRGRK